LRERGKPNVPAAIFGVAAVFKLRNEYGLGCRSTIGSPKQRRMTKLDFLDSSMAA
jgi:hypothetical protein